MRDGFGFGCLTDCGIHLRGIRLNPFLIMARRDDLRDVASLMFITVLMNALSARSVSCSPILSISVLPCKVGVDAGVLPGNAVKERR